MHTVLEVIAVIAIVAYVIGRQLRGEPQRAKRLVVLPAVLALVGAVDLGKDGRHPQPIDFVFIALSALVAIAIGLWQGASMRLQNRDGGLWGQMPPRSLWLWAALAASRLVIGVIADASGAHVAASTASILLILGINRLAQAASILARSVAAGIPLAPEKTDTPLPASATPQSGAAPTSDAPARDGAQVVSWQSTGRQIASSLGDGMQDRRARRRDRRRR